MIRREDVKKIGQLFKPYGYQGAISLLFDNAAFSKVEAEYYFLDIDGLLVPFFVEEIRFKNDTLARVKFEDVDDDTKASRFANIEVFIALSDYQEIVSNEEVSWRDFIGFQVVDEVLSPQLIGTIVDVDEATINTLFVVKKGDVEVLIPATEDFIVRIDTERKILSMRLPEGLV